MTGPSGPKGQSVNPIFGDPLPMASIDERDEGSSADDEERDQWLRDNVPPHHG
jgi:hypothetical protein